MQLQVFLIYNPLIANAEKKCYNSSFHNTSKYFRPKITRKTNAILHIEDLDWAKKTDIPKSQKKLQSGVLT